MIFNMFIKPVFVNAKDYICFTFFYLKFNTKT